MKSLDKSHTTVVQAFDKCQIPQGACPIQRNRHQLGAKPAKFVFRSRRSQLTHAYVVLDGEIGIVEPRGRCLTEQARTGSLP